MSFYTSRPVVGPLPPYHCDVVDVLVGVVPYVLNALYWRMQKYHWLTPYDAMIARQALAQQGAELLMGCKAEILFEHRRLYRLMDTALMGQTYIDAGTLDDDGMPIVLPALPNAPQVEAVYPSALSYMLKTANLADNFVNGVSNDDSSDTRNVRQQIEDLILAVEALVDENGITYEQGLEIIALLGA